MQDLRLSDFTFQYRFPYPVSASFRQMKVAISPSQKISLLHDTFSSLLEYLAAVSICEYLSGDEKSGGIEDSLNELTRPSLGQWLGIFRDIQDWFSERGRDPLIPELAESWREKNYRKDFLKNSESILSRRNELAHGKPPSSESVAEKIFQEQKAGLNELLRALIFLSLYPLAYVDGLRYQEGVFWGFFHKAMGADSSFATQPVSADTPFEEQSVFLLGRNMERILNLRPFYVIEPCPKCDMEHVFVYNQVKSNRIKYVSVQHGHDFTEAKDPETGDGAHYARLRGLLRRDERLRPLIRVRIPDKTRRSIAAPQIAVEEGESLAGKYKVMGLINHGGMGDVFLGHHITLDKPVAIKIMRQDLGREDRYVARFHREARTLGKLQHPNIVRVLDNGIENDRHFIIEEYVPNGDLHDRLIREKPIPEGEALRIVLEVARGLAHAHENGVIHRDIKPSNILFKEDATAVLTDFGIAKDPAFATMLTATADVMGTSVYMSPEQKQALPPAPDSDIYSLGLVLLEMLGGNPGADKINIDALLGVSKRAIYILSKMLAPRGKRPLDGRALVELLEEPPVRESVMDRAIVDAMSSDRERFSSAAQSERNVYVTLFFSIPVIIGAMVLQRLPGGILPYYDIPAYLVVLLGAFFFLWMAFPAGKIFGMSRGMFSAGYMSAADARMGESIFRAWGWCVLLCGFLSFIIGLRGMFQWRYGWGSADARDLAQGFATAVIGLFIMALELSVFWGSALLSYKRRRQSS